MGPGFAGIGLRRGNDSWQKQNGKNEVSHGESSPDGNWKFPWQVPNNRPKPVAVRSHIPM
jgi:hypothetical protein